ncbi:membrane protein [Bordetella pertussis]|uniref:Predicted permease, DMT superfamily n=7 Tax=Bordetella TaxID=517 RepID=A0A0E7URC0_BORPT|nr:MULTISPECIES: DMT family transporter [Bordetella]ETH38952.1 EamA-like transporter family protein [Bordetella pertussis H918]ETH44974.1 EamA-like transporter family protein [Bordetella pertussis H939]ETH48349.1 EamA-like transporter family protein [Bordetella pertussis H921]ETH71515.1 EamA-like transporter family protein [Bordetella pertussis STO1-CHLA-0011]ETH83513.1 EamA-like transporter family protein [Bordetella pertussis STO1-CHOC-0017]ETH87480.1 EamA-like transporter family protein [B
MTRQRALVYIHIAAVLFGLTGVFGELIQAGAAVITLGRALFAVGALAVFARMQRRSLLGVLTPAQLFVLVIAGCLLAAHWVTFFISVKVGGIAIATLGFASFPAFITLFEGLVFRERVRLAEWLLLGLVTAGLVLVTPSFDLADQGTVGLVWGLVSGFSFAMLALTNRRAAAGMDPMQVACWQNAVVALVMLPFAVVHLPALHALDWLWVALLGIFCTGLSHYLFVSSLTRLNARSAGLVIALEPVYAIGFAWILFTQVPTLRMLAGAALIVAAIVWSGLRKSTH